MKMRAFTLERFTVDGFVCPLWGSRCDADVVGSIFITGHESDFPRFLGGTPWERSTLIRLPSI